MRTPMENGFGSIGTQLVSNIILNLSRELWQIARMTCEVSIVSFTPYV